MEAFCDFMYIPPSDEKAAAINGISSRNNVVLIPYSILKNAKISNNSASLIQCRACSAALTFLSKLLTKEEYNRKLEEEAYPEVADEQKAREEVESGFTKGRFIKDLKDNEKGWICEYCGVHNRVPEDIVVPETEDTLYLIKQNVAHFKQEETKTTDSAKDTFPEDETSMIFAIDVSGSMSETYRVSNDGRTVTKKRFELIGEAVLKQLESMKIQYPNRKVGFVLFNYSVRILGDCMHGDVSLNEDFENFQKLWNYSQLKGEALLKTGLHESFPRLQTAIQTLFASGGTALGPGLISSVSLASKGGAGSRVILCTDGLANVGIGSLESGNNTTLQKSQEFYHQLGEVAVGHGVSVSIITVKGNACKVDALGPLTDRTAGTITRVDPADLDLSEIAANNLVARDVSLKVILHEVLSFQNEESSNLQNNNTILAKKVGSVSESNEVYFEYKVKNLQELEKEQISLETLDWVPLQSQITYTDLSGNVFVRVICKKQELTRDQKKLKQNIKADVLAGFVEKQAANLVLNGDMEKAQQQNEAWGDVMEQLCDDVDCEGEVRDAFKQMKVQQVATNQLIQQSAGMEVANYNQAMKDDITSTWFSKKQAKKK